MAVANLPLHRHQSLMASFEAMRRSDLSLDEHGESQVLLFGLDNGLISPAEISTILQKHEPRHILISARFAVRLAELGDLSLWTNLWRQGPLFVREWLLISAFDQLGQDIRSLPFEPPIKAHDELKTLWEFLEWWHGADIDLSPPSRIEPLYATQNPIWAEVEPRLSSSLVIVGFSGAGKSTAVDELVKAGLGAVDADKEAVAGGDRALELAFSQLGATRARELLFSRLIESQHGFMNYAVLALGASTTNLAAGRRLLLEADALIIHFETSVAVTISRLRHDRDHPLHKFCADAYGARQVSRVQEIRADTYYTADCSIHTDRLTAIELCELLRGLL